MEILKNRCICNGIDPEYYLCNNSHPDTNANILRRVLERYEQEQAESREKKQEREELKQEIIDVMKKELEKELPQDADDDDWGEWEELSCD